MSSCNRTYFLYDSKYGVTWLAYSHPTIDPAFVFSIQQLILRLQVDISAILCESTDGTLISPYAMGDVNKTIRDFSTKIMDKINSIK